MGKRGREGTLDKARCLAFVHQLWDKDKLKMFHHPISATELPDYHKVINYPVDLSTIRQGIESGKYDSDADVQNAVAQMIANALEYNAKGTEWHQQALSFRSIYLDVARQCGLSVDDDAAYIPSAAFKDDESTLRKAEKKIAENLDVVLKDLEEDKAVPLEELRAKYKRAEKKKGGKNADVSDSDESEESEESEESDEIADDSDDSDEDSDDDSDEEKFYYDDESDDE
ncbi:hypothetical protein TcBrA4_0039100 [Trypanosoma cruzi]|nr:hypothetical protein TcBrA4_0039100 [Trypanosoma cruzi]